MRLTCVCGFETPMAECEEELEEGGRIEQFLFHHQYWECHLAVREALVQHKVDSIGARRRDFDAKIHARDMENEE